MTQTTSRVFAAWRGVHALLTEQVTSWPSHPVTNRRPQVVFGAPPYDLNIESVCVIGRLEDDEPIEWATVGRGPRRERFSIQIDVRTFVQGHDADRCVDRLEELSDYVQGCFWQPELNRWNGPIAEGEPGYLNSGGVIRVTPAVEALDEGWGGVCTILLAVHTLI